MPDTAPQSCPRCASSTVRVANGQPWCPACEWNLAVYDPVELPPRGWRWLEKRAHRLASRLDRSLFAELSREQVSRPGWSAGYLTLVAVSVLLLGAILATFGIGCWLVVARAGPGWVALGVLLMLLAVFLRPRLYRAPRRKKRLSPEQAPTLILLVERMSARLGVGPPDYLVLDESFNASVERSGFRQRTTLTIGLPLWLCLPPQDRIALLGHELAHLVNGDPRRSLLVRPAIATFVRLAEWTGARRSLMWVLNPDRPPRDLARLIAELTAWALSRVFLTILLVLSAISARDHQRSEYLADNLAARIAGSAAMIDLLDRSLLTERTMNTLYYAAERHSPAEWRLLVDAQIQARSGGRSMRRQLSRRRTDLWRSHPPDGLRAGLLERYPALEPGLLMTDAAAAQIDRELAPQYRRLHRTLLGARDFRPNPSPSGGEPRPDGSITAVV